MLRSVRTSVIEALDAAFESHAALHRRFRVHAVHARNLISDDDLVLRAFDRRGQLGRPVATVVLEGEALVRVPGQASRVSAGQAFAVAHKASVSLRCEAAPVYRTLVFEWDDELAERPADAPFATFPLDPAELARAERLWSALRGPWRPARMRAAVVRHAADLRRAGVPLKELDPEALIERVPRRFVQLSAAVDEQLSRIDAQPMVVDLEARLGLSSRQLSRSVRELNERYGFNADGWIDLRNRRRVMLAAALLARADARVAVVAQAVGYTSPQGMARALADAGLPAPTRIAEAVAALRG